MAARSGTAPSYTCSGSQLQNPKHSGVFVPAVYLSSSPTTTPFVGQLCVLRSLVLDTAPSVKPSLTTHSAAPFPFPLSAGPCLIFLYAEMYLVSALRL